MCMHLCVSVCRRKVLVMIFTRTHTHIHTHQHTNRYLEGLIHPNDLEKVGTLEQHQMARKADGVCVC